MTPAARLTSLLWRYGVALLAVALALLLRWLLRDPLGPRATFITFYPAVALVAMLAGAGPGVLATLLSALICDLWLFEPYGRFGLNSTGDTVALTLFITAGLLISAIAATLQRTQRRHQEAERQHLLAVAQRDREQQSRLLADSLKNAAERAAAALQQQKDLLAVTLESIGDGVIVTNNESRIISLNAEAERLTGWKSAAAVGQLLPSVFHIINEDTRQTVENPVTKVLRLGQVVGLANHTVLIAQDGREIPIDDSGAPIRQRDGTVRGVVLVFRDFSGKKRAEREREIAIECLHLVNANVGVQELIEASVRFFHQQSGCEAVGIRLRADDDYPYYLAHGFPEQFVQAENSLCVRGDTSELERDSAGNPLLACLCGNVIRGRFDPTKPFFTPAGSFWTNSTTELLAGTTDADRQACTRNRCNKEGYESVALIALRIGTQRLGLLQLNDRRKNRFTPESIALWERLAGYLAVALAQARAQEALRHSEERFRTLVEQSPDGIFIADTQGHYRDVNSAGCQMLGYTREEILRLTIADVVVPEETPRITPELASYAGGQIVRSEWRFRRKDGSLFPGEVVGRKLPDGRLQAILRDITARQQAEEALRESAERLQRSQEISHLGSWELDLVTNRLTWSDEVYRIFGLQPQQFGATYQAFLERVHPEDRAAVDAAYSSSLREGKDSYEIEHRVVRQPSGEIRWVQEKCTHLRDPHGHIIRSLGMVLDITQRKQAEEFLRRYELLANYSRDVILFIRRDDGRILEANAAATQVYGYSREELLPLRIHDLRAPDTLAAIDAEMAQADERGILFQSLHRRKDGTTFPVEISARGATVGGTRMLISVVRDITQRKQAEEALLAAKLATEQASQAKDHFLAVLSHELRTPLTPIVASISMLQRQQGFDPATQENLELIRRNAELEARLIDDLLDVTRIARGKVELDRQPVELCTIVRQAVEVCRPDIEARQLEFGLDIQHPPHFVLADAARLQQVFWNLLKNAIKFTPHGGCVGIRIQCDEGANEKGATGPGGQPPLDSSTPRPLHPSVLVEVQDSGVGIAPELLSRIFNAFEQGGVGTTRQFGGLGLGLAICKGLVEMHGGQISAHSPGQGQGATFRVQLPLVAPIPTASATLPHGPPPSAPRPLRILLVEDHGDTARTMQLLLRGEGHRITLAGDVATALDLAAREPFDLLLSDLGLPDGTGIDLLTHLRARGQTFPAIALFGYGQEQDLARSRAAGFATHLTKPVNIDHLLRTITAVTAPPPPAPNFPPTP